MTMETLANKIQRVRDRLAEIETERSSLEPDDFSRKADLMDEERTLEARLGELKDEAAREGVGIAEETVGRATDYERVPDVGDESADTENGETQ
jgi:predicted nuclease with TOPRIM domain